MSLTTNICPCASNLHILTEVAFSTFKVHELGITQGMDILPLRYMTGCTTQGQHDISQANKGLLKTRKGLETGEKDVLHICQLSLSDILVFGVLEEKIVLK